MTSRPLLPEQKRSLEEATGRYEQHRSAVEPYLEARGFDLATATDHRLGYVLSPVPGHEGYRGRLAIPYIGPRGNIYQMRFRCVAPHECKEIGCPKYLGLDALETRLFNLRALTTESYFVVITEGELDTVSLTQIGVPSVGVPGADAWKRHHRRLFDGFERVVVIGDNDKAGSNFVRKIRAELRQAVAVTLDPEYNDLNEVLEKEGPDGLRERVALD